MEVVIVLLELFGIIDDDGSF